MTELIKTIAEYPWTSFFLAIFILVVIESINETIQTIFRK